MADTYPDTRGPQFDAQLTPAQSPGFDEDELLTKFAAWDVELTNHWSKWMEDTRLAYAFVAGEQWTEGEKSEMDNAEKIAVTFNLIDPVVSAVQGAEIQNRQQVQYYPRNQGDTGVSDVLTQGAEYVTDECNGDQEDSEAFWDALVCGVGWTELRPEIDGDQVMLVKERVDPLQIKADPASRKRCFEDMRYLKREIPMSDDELEDFREEIGRDEDDDLGGLEGQTIGGKRLTIVNPAVRYTHGLLGGDPAEDGVIVCEWQWWEREKVFLAGIPDPASGVVKITALSQEELNQAREADPSLRFSASHRKAYYRAFATATEVLFQERLPEGDFRYKAITGKRQRNTGTWFGLVKAMLDPQRFTNKLYSEILHIIRTNANGGMALEEDAVDDIRQFEATWAATDKITWLKPGSLSGQHGPKMKTKDPPQIQVALFQLMEFAKDMVKATTGVNEEILGLVGREQAGVLEQQRKQAAYGILSAFFDAKRRYQRNQGRLLLGSMRAYFPPDKLVRLVDQGTAQYVPLATSLEAQEYDIVVDEAPQGPDQKAKILQVLMPLVPQLLEGGLIGPDVVAEVITYLPIPAAVANKLADAIRKQAQNAGQPDPAQQALAQAELQNKQADTASKAADVGKKQADAVLSRAKAAKEITETHARHVDLLAPTPQPAPNMPFGPGPQAVGAGAPPSGGPGAQGGLGQPGGPPQAPPDQDGDEAPPPQQGMPG